MSKFNVKRAEIMVDNYKKLAKLADRVFFYSAISFNNIIQDLLRKKFESENLKTDSLLELEQYFHTIKVRNKLMEETYDIEEMIHWKNTIMLTDEFVIRSYKLKNKNVDIKLTRKALEDLIDICSERINTES